jgi:hypothetical protein
MSPRSPSALPSSTASRRGRCGVTAPSPATSTTSRMWPPPWATADIAPIRGNAGIRRGCVSMSERPLPRALGRHRCRFAPPGAQAVPPAGPRASCRARGRPTRWRPASRAWRLVCAAVNHDVQLAGAVSDSTEQTRNRCGFERGPSSTPRQRGTFLADVCDGTPTVWRLRRRVGPGA